MEGFSVSFFTEQDRRIGRRLVIEWLMDLSKELHIGGATSYAGIEGWAAVDGAIRRASLTSPTDR